MNERELNNLGATEEEQKKSPTVELKRGTVPSTFINWTETFLAGIGETLVLLYLLLASGDLFLQKLVHVMPTLRDKKRAVEISHEVQQNISNYLFSVSTINIGLGIVVSAGLYFMGVPNAAMWGMFVAVLNFVPYFGPIAGIIVLATVGLLTFDTLWKAMLPAAWYFLRARTSRGIPRDPVARFHLGNGARLERLNFLADTSARALAQSHGLMVNYLYDLDYIERNHEAYAQHRAVVAASAVTRLVNIPEREIVPVAG